MIGQLLDVALTGAGLVSGVASLWLLVRDVGGWRRYVARRVLPWTIATVASIGVALWSARRIDLAKAGTLPPEVLPGARTVLLIATVIFMVVMGVMIWQVRSRPDHGESRGPGMLSGSS